MTTNYTERIRALEAEGMSTSDAQAVLDAQLDVTHRVCRTCGEPIEEYPDAFSGGWTHADIDTELSADHAAALEA